MGNLLHVGFPSALVILAIALGSLYVLPAFFMYRKFDGDRIQVALSSILLLSMADVMIYSTTVARPTLLDLFLVPLAIAALQSLYERFRWPAFFGLLLASAFAIFIGFVKPTRFE